MGVFDTFTSVSVPLLLRSSRGIHRLKVSPTELFQRSSLWHCENSIQMINVFSFRKFCLSSSSRRILSQSCPLIFHKSLLHNTLWCSRTGLQGATREAMLRVRVGLLEGSVGKRLVSDRAKQADNYHRRTGLIYVCAAGIFMLGMSYAGVPLYRMFCQATGLGGTVSRGHDTSKIESMQSVPERIIKVRFNADVASSMRWNFKPQQTEVKVLPGETALAFYTAKNPTDKPIIGISTYNVVPFEAGLYFNKIQCFCFEEQRLNPHEQVDMPVFFYIDPDFTEDPKLEGVETITLSYTFFEAKEGFQVPLPGYMTQAQ